MAALGDLDGDAVMDLAVGAVADDDGGSGAGAVYIINLEKTYCESPSPTTLPTTSEACYTDGTAKNVQKNSMLYGNFNTFYTLDADNSFGTTAALGDIDGDGVVDMAVGAHIDNDGGANAGAVYILFLESDGTVKDAQKVSKLYSNFNAFYTLDAGDKFGASSTALGDLNSDGVTELAVGAVADDDGGTDAGAVYILFLESDGTIKNAQKLSMLYGNFGMFYTLAAGDRFSISVAGSGNVDGDNVADLVVGANWDDDGGTDAGAVYLLFMITDGAIKNAQKLSMLYGNLDAFYTLDAGDQLGFGLAALGDFDSDGVTNLAAGAHADDDGSADAGSVYVLFLETDGHIKTAQKVSMLYGSFSTFYVLAADDILGVAIAALGDADGDLVPDMAVSTYNDDDGGTNTGSLYAIFLKSDGNVKAAQKLSMLYGNFNAFYALDASDLFAFSMAALGDIDGDGVVELAVGAILDDDGGSGAGAVYIINLETYYCDSPSPTTLPTISEVCHTDGTAKNAQKISTMYGNLDTFYTLIADDNFCTIAAMGDIDGDGVVDMAVGAHKDDNGGADAGAIYILFLGTDGTVKDAQKLSMLYGSFNLFYSLDAGDKFGISTAALGDLDSDGVTDLAVGAEVDDDGGTGAGAAYVLFLETDGTIKSAQKLSMLYGNFGTFYTLAAGDHFSISVAGLGDVDGDNVADLAVGSFLDGDGGVEAGAVYLLFMETDGVIKTAQKLSMLYGNFNAFYTLNAGDKLGFGLAALGDIDGDGATDIAVGAYKDDDGGVDAGAVYVLFLETNGITHTVQKVSMLYGGFSNFYVLGAGDILGSAIAALSDADGDMVPDVVVSAYHDDDGGTGAGAAYMLFLNSDGNVKTAQKLSMLYGNFNAYYALDASDLFAFSIAALGDLDSDGVVDLAIGTLADDDGGSAAGAVYIVNLETSYCDSPSPTAPPTISEVCYTDGTAKNVQKLSAMYGNLDAFYTIDAGDSFGTVAALGDIDGDGIVDMAVGAKMTTMVVLAQVQCM